MRSFFGSFWHLITAPFRFTATIFRRIWQSFRSFWAFFAEEPEETSLPDAFSKAVERPADLFDHLNALRKHLFRSVFVLFLAAGAAFVYIEELLAWLTQPIGGLDSLQAIEVTEPLSVAMRVSLLAGFSLALPYLTFELWMFAAPGLKRRARFSGLIAIPLATIFFIAGMAFAYYVMLPAAIPFLLNFLGISAAVRPASYVRFATGIMFWLGLAFEFPLVIFALASMGIVRAKTLAAHWRIAVVVIAIASAAITPTVDPINMALVMGPMILLYFLSIGLAYLAQGRRKIDAD